MPGQSSADHTISGGTFASPLRSPARHGAARTASATGPGKIRSPSPTGRPGPQQKQPAKK